MPTWLLLAEAAALLVIAGRAWRRRYILGARAFVGAVLAITLYVAGFALELPTSEVRQLYWIVSVEYVGIAFSAPALVIFFATITRFDGWLTPFRRRGLLALAGLLVVIKFSDPWLGGIYHSMTTVRQGGWWINTFEPGPWYWVMAAYSEAAFLFGLVAVWRVWRNAGRLFRRQLIALAAACLYPWIAHLVYLSGHSPWGRLDVVPFALLATTLTLQWAVFHARLVALAPVARDFLVETFREGVVVTDTERSLADFNPAACRMLRLTDADWGRPVGQVLSHWPELPALCARNESATIEFAPMTEGETHWQADWHRLTDPAGRPAGFLLHLRDVTETKRTEAELQRLVASRTYAWQESARMALRAIDAEHARFDRSLREAWKPEMAELVHRLELLGLRVRAAGDAAIAGEVENLAREIAEAACTVRKVSHLLGEKDNDYESLTGALEETLRHIGRATGVFCELQMDPTFPAFEPERGRLLLGIVREAAVNAMARGPVRRLTVVCGCPQHVPTVAIVDDGEGDRPDASVETLNLAHLRMRAELLGARMETRPGATAGMVLELVFAADAPERSVEAAGG